MHTTDIVDDDSAVERGIGGAPGNGTIRIGQHFRTTKMIVMTGIELARTRHT